MGRFRAVVAAVLVVVGVAQVSAPSVSAQDRAAPGRPTAVAAQTLHKELLVTWKPPASTGGRSIQSYRITVNGQVLGSVRGGARSLTITGLSNGVAYRVGVAARNADGLGPAAFVSGTPQPVPGAPALDPPTSTFVDVFASWSATAGTRPTRTTDFRIQVSTNNGSTWTTVTPSVRNGRTAVFRDMIPGRRYVFRVAGKNAAGWGAWSNTRSITIAKKKATAVTGGQGHYCALVEDTSVRCWGENTRGQLGNGTTTLSRTPVLVRNADASALVGVTQVSASAFNTCVLLQSTEVRCWGDNNFSRVSDDNLGAAITSPVTITDTGASTGTPITGVVQVDVGFSNTCVLVTGGAVRCWGGDATGELGDGPDDSSGGTPVDVVTADGPLGAASSIAVGGNTSCALVGDGVWCWGSDSNLQLGDGASSANSAVAVPVVDASEEPLSGVTALSGVHHTFCALRAEGAVSCWGRDGNHLLADDDTVANRGFAADVTTDGSTAFTGATSVFPGWTSGCATVLDDGGVCWGRNASLETATFPSSVVGDVLHPAPVKLDPTTPFTGLAAFAVANASTCALTTTGAVRCWGLNGFGQAGDGSTGAVVAVPVLVSGF